MYILDLRQSEVLYSYGKSNKGVGWALFQYESDVR